MHMANTSTVSVHIIEQVMISSFGSGGFVGNFRRMSSKVSGGSCLKLQVLKKCEYVLSSFEESLYVFDFRSFLFSEFSVLKYFHR